MLYRLLVVNVCRGGCGVGFSTEQVCRPILEIGLFGWGFFFWVDNRLPFGSVTSMPIPKLCAFFFFFFFSFDNHPVRGRILYTRVTRRLMNFKLLF